MPNLIDQICDLLLELPEAELHRTAVIFPGRRAGTVLRNTLASRIDKPIFSPAIFSMPDLLEEETGMKISDSLQLSFDLYAAYLQLNGDEVFENYLKWGPAVLRDFSEIDAYLLDANKVFGYLSQEKAIELWEPEKGYLGESAQQFLAFYRQLGNLYEQLTNSCLANGEGWQSLLCRNWHQQLQHHSKSRYEHYIFAGFNALNTAEQGCIRELISLGKARLLLDADRYYTENEHEAGLFIRKLAKDPLLGRDIRYNGKLLAPDTRIQIYACPGQSAQLQQAGTIVQGWLDEGLSLETCVVVLADEQLLIPLLTALPEACGKLNITMGYPLNRSQAYALLQAHMLLAEQVNNRDIPVYFHHQLLQLLLNPLFDAKASKAAIRALEKEGRISLSLAQFPEEVRRHRVFELLAHPGSPADCLVQWCKLFSELADGGQADELQAGMCFQLVQVLRQLSQRLLEFPELNQWVVFKPFIRQQLYAVQLAFLGEPYQGLQIMGLLETRALAYPNVLVLGMNEGNLPAQSRQDGFITYSLRQEFGLPGAHEKEAVYAYHFYRLLQHAHRSWLLCNSNTDDMGQGEASRYLRQLSMEWPGRTDNRLIEKQLALPKIRAAEVTRDISIVKTEAVMRQVRQALETPLSPSALINWQSCKLRFYFSRILRLKQQTEIQDEVDARELGDILHKALEYLYQPYLNQPLRPEDVDQMLVEAPKILDRAIQECYPMRNFEAGLNLIIKQIAGDYLHRFLKSEKQLCQQHSLEIVGLETELSAQIVGEKVSLTIRGIADRIERLDQRLRIVDYKTGLFQPADVQLKTLPDDFGNPQKSKAFQLLCYAWLYQRNHELHIGELDSRIISFRKLNSPEAGFLQIPGGELTEEVLQAFEVQLRTQIDLIFDTNQPFDQTTDTHTCTTCDFQKICNR